MCRVFRDLGFGAFGKGARTPYPEGPVYTLTGMNLFYVLEGVLGGSGGLSMYI